MTLHLRSLVTSIFLLSISLIPLLGLLWDQDFSGFKLNWILYPLILLSLITVLIARNSIPKEFLQFFFILSAFTLLIAIRSGELESCVRLFFSLLPIYVYDYFIEFTSPRTRRRTTNLFIICLTIPVVIAILQLLGKVPYENFDAVEGQAVGRLSGGYSKPNNFVIYLFPLFLLGIQLIKTKRFRAIFILALTLSLVYLTGLRIAVFIFGAILLASLFPKWIIVSVKIYYKYYLNFLVGFLSFLGVYLLYQKYGLINLLRGRLVLWQSHANEFLHAGPFNILFGQGKTFLHNTGELVDGPFRRIEDIKSLNEVHNNSFRIIILFGLIGYFFYCLAVRGFVLKALKVSVTNREKFIVAASFFCLIIFSTTNEPLFYPAIFWSMLFWVFIKPS